MLPPQTIPERKWEIVRHKKFPALLTDGLTKEWCIAIHLFWVAVRRLSKSSGWLFTALYIKQSSVALQRFAAGDTIPTGMSPSVSLTRRGLPRIIPPFHRARISAGDVAIIQLYMSLFTVSKLIPLAPRATRKTFESIVTPVADLDSLISLVSDLRDVMNLLIRRYMPFVQTIPLNQGLRFVPTWKSLPTGPWLSRFGGTDGKRIVPSCFSALPYELANFASLVQFVHARGEQFSHGVLWPPFTRFAKDSFNKRITEQSLEIFEATIGPYLPTTEQLGIPMCPGRLSAVCSGDGKLRLFAIGNYVNQRLLYPVHQWCADVLRRLPMDGTFNQSAPLDRLAGSPGVIYSVDLKSATDRWPLLVMFEFVQALFDRSFASSVVNTTLGTNLFDVTFTKSQRSVSFVAGQPLGYYSSWPLFALSHHLIVWFAAELIRPGRYFDRYALLGDDIVIADKPVALMYMNILERMGVGISHSKSITSSSGACEFAKKFRLFHCSVDVSPVSVKNLSKALCPIDWYNLTLTLNRPVRLSTLLRVGGFGFRASSRPLSSRTHGKRVRRLIALRLYGILPLYIWFHCILGYFPSPEVIGAVIERLREHYAPVDPRLPPLAHFPYPGMHDFLEWSLYRGWMEQYLKYLKWYCKVALNPSAELQDFLDPPVYVATWHRPKVDLSTFRFGVMFRVIDWVSEETVRGRAVLG